MLGGFDGVGGVGFHHLAGDEPVEEHPQAGQVLLDSGCGVVGGEIGQVGGDVVALDRGQGEAAFLGPGEEAEAIAVVGRPRVLVGDGVGEEGKEPLTGLVALIGDGGGQAEAAAHDRYSGAGGDG